MALNVLLLWKHHGFLKSPGVPDSGGRKDIFHYINLDPSLMSHGTSLLTCLPPWQHSHYSEKILRNVTASHNCSIHLSPWLLKEILHKIRMNGLSVFILNKKKIMKLHQNSSQFHQILTCFPAIVDYIVTKIGPEKMQVTHCLSHHLPQPIRRKYLPHYLNWFFTVFILETQVK